MKRALVLCRLWCCTLVSACSAPFEMSRLYTMLLDKRRLEHAEWEGPCSEQPLASP